MRSITEFVLLASLFRNMTSGPLHKNEIHLTAHSGVVQRAESGAQDLWGWGGAELANRVETKAVGSDCQVLAATYRIWLCRRAAQNAQTCWGG